MNDVRERMYQRLPRFAQIDLQQIPEQLDRCLEQARTDIQQLCDQYTGKADASLLDRLNDIDETISMLWSPVTHLNGVADSEALRKIYPDCLAKVSEFYTDLGQNRSLFKCYRSLRQGDTFEKLSPERQKAVDNAIRDFKLSGVDLEDEDRQSFKTLKTELSRLGNEFERHLLDETEAWHLHITDEADLSGLPENALAAGRESAKRAGLDGWRFGLQMPSYLPIIRYADNRDLRERCYRAYVTRASELGQDAGRDNSATITRILQIRQQLAGLQGRPHYADLALTTKMANSAEQVTEFLLELAQRARAVAEKEVAELQAFAAEFDGPDKLEAWDIAYYSEKLREYNFAFSEEEVREYFPAPRVIEGLFEVVERLFGISAGPARAPDSWHPDVGFYELKNADGNTIGGFYVDLYAREGKRGGAWMDVCLDRRAIEEKVYLPAAYLTCNFSPPLTDRPSLLTHDDVETLFHEFGHCLHHLLTEVDEPDVGGINGVAWDAVELPSQFLEHWCWEREALDLIAGHYQTRKKIPDTLVKKMRDAKTFQSGLQTLRQVEFALFDMQLHTGFDAFASDSVQAVLDQVRAQVAVLPVPEFNRFQNSFSHIFAGGYAAGYYSYKWAEVLSSDAFSRFEDEGVFNPDTGRDFRNHILARGGSEDAGVLFKRFRGRDPDMEPLLRHSGLLASA